MNRAEVTKGIEFGYCSLISLAWLIISSVRTLKRPRILQQFKKLTLNMSLKNSLFPELNAENRIR